jgi:hypothetical protein
MFEAPDRARDAQPPRAPDRPTPAAPAAAPNQPTKSPDSAHSSKPPTRANNPPAPPPERSARRPSPPRSEPARPAPASSPPHSDDDNSQPDANALIERLRRQRQQREAEQAAHERAQRPQPHAGSDTPVEQRFAAGDAIFCLPYGDGVVRASRIEDGQELLTVSVPAYGDLTIDPAKSLVRKLDNAAPEEDDLL